MTAIRLSGERSTSSRGDNATDGGDNDFQDGNYPVRIAVTISHRPYERRISSKRPS